LKTKRTRFAQYDMKGRSPQVRIKANHRQHTPIFVSHTQQPTHATTPQPPLPLHLTARLCLLSLSISSYHKTTQ